MNYKNFIELLSKRKSCRNYSTRDVSQEAINNCLEAARLAPSACNKQPWKFIIVKNSTIKENLYHKALLPCLPMPWIQNAPVIVAICAESDFITHKLAPFISNIDYRLIDIGITGEHFVLAAEAQGLASCWIGWFKQKKVKKILKIPKKINVISLMTLGYSAEENVDVLEKKSIYDISFYDMLNQK
jgi:nitroreductase